ncbi:hypothetical protein E2C01_084194 [Portunus trituberculatus]|uniref:Uncharacterized protein n=1 Tax=Portunus trituberculatus TaxID=210409 RepID=A0A5B7J6T3_PORTR|nr:hypothetical protein [Portunus trituberculatus]
MRNVVFLSAEQATRTFMFQLVNVTRSLLAAGRVGAQGEAENSDPRGDQVSSVTKKENPHKLKATKRNE